MRFLLSVFLSVFLFSHPVFGQTEKPQTIIVPTGSLGEISELRTKMLEKTLESQLDDFFAIVKKIRKEADIPLVLMTYTD